MILQKNTKENKRLNLKNTKAISGISANAERGRNIYV